MSRDIFVATAAGVTLAAASFTLGVGATKVYDNLVKGQGQGQGQGDANPKDTRLAPCTCTPPDREHEQPSKKCPKHDQLLLLDITELISSKDKMFQLGISLGMRENVIQAYYTNNRDSIWEAVRCMLFEWYGEQDGLRRNSHGLVELERALEKCRLGSYGKDIIKDHFEDR